MDHIWLLLLSGKICQIQPFRGQRSAGTWVIEATEVKYEVQSHLRGHLEATMASEATKVAAPANTHIDHMVIEVSLFESDVKFDLQGH